MITCYHGSPELFDKFDLGKTGEGTGIKYGAGVNLSETEATAVHYSQPRKQAIAKNHYLYTVEIPDLADGNHLVSAKPVHPDIIKRTEAKLCYPVPQEILQPGKEFRKWLGMTLTGSEKVSLASEKAAAAFLDSIGVFCIIWPHPQRRTDAYNNWLDMGPKNLVVFDANKVTIKQTEHFEGYFKGKRFVMVENSRKVVYKE